MLYQTTKALSRPGYFLISSFLVKVKSSFSGSCHYLETLLSKTCLYCLCLLNMIPCKKFNVSQNTKYPDRDTLVS